MASVNKIILIGNCGKDPEVRYLPDGTAVANITLATSESWKDKQTGEKKELTEWHRVSFFGKLAEIVSQYVKKGSSLYVEGSLRTEKWQDKEGRDQQTTKVRADVMKMLGGRKDEQPAGNSASAPVQNKPQSAPAQGGGAFDDMTDDIPF